MQLVAEAGVTYTSLASAPLRPTPSHQLCAPLAADSLVVGVTEPGTLRVWAVAAPTNSACDAVSVSEMKPGITQCGRASIVTALPQTTLNCTDPHLPMIAVGYMDGTVDMLTINPPAQTLDASHEPLSLWTRFLSTDQRAAVTHLAMSSSLRVAVVCDDAPDVVRIFQAASSLYR